MYLFIYVYNDNPIILTINQDGIKGYSNNLISDAKV